MPKENEQKEEIHINDVKLFDITIHTFLKK